MSGSKTELFILYQMGSSQDYTWYSVVAVFLSEEALREYARKKGVDADLVLLSSDQGDEIVLDEPEEFVAVRSEEGVVPEVSLPEGLMPHGNP
jgi:hypothetical protein